ncbi:MAG TPA: hypothetical protein VMW89_14950 [Desulfatiglandales bacterium]|nr:hypothetical protein [Desulfatiglandales bacterium]
MAMRKSFFAFSDASIAITAPEIRERASPHTDRREPYMKSLWKYCSSTTTKLHGTVVVLPTDTRRLRYALAGPLMMRLESEIVGRAGTLRELVGEVTDRQPAKGETHSKKLQTLWEGKVCESKLMAFR